MPETSVFESVPLKSRVSRITYFARLEHRGNRKLLEEVLTSKNEDLLIISRTMKGARIYILGPFSNKTAASSTLKGISKDLKKVGAKGIKSNIFIDSTTNIRQ